MILLDIVDVTQRLIMLHLHVSALQKRALNIESAPRHDAWRLLRAFNHLSRESRDLATLLESMAGAIQGALDPTTCVIWLYTDPAGRDEAAAVWIGSKPPLCLTERRYEDSIQPGTLSPQALKDGRLRAAFDEAGVSLATPVIHQQEVIGWLGIGPARSGQNYPAETGYFLEILAGEAAVAIRAVRLEAELERSVGQLRRAYRQIIQAQENERRCLAGTLHDETLQQLADLSVRVGLLRSQAKVEPAELEDLQDRLARTDRSLREIVGGIQPAVLADLGLIEAIIAFLETCPFPNPGRPPVSVKLRVRGFNGRRLPDQELELALYRFTQNALRNALSHAQPSQIEISLAWEANAVTVEIKDNGCGMEITIEEAVRAGHFGLLTMRERIKAFGGSFTLRTKPGQGVWLRGWVPVTTASPTPERVEHHRFELG